MTESVPVRRIRSMGVSPGIIPPGPLNAITDVDGVRVGHITKQADPAVRTGVTAILPHGGNLYRDRVPAGFAVANGHGKIAGATQLEELGEIETPIVLVNTLSVGRAVEAVVDWTLTRPGNEDVRTVNALVAETNDGELNDIRARGLDREDVLAALDAAAAGPVAEGCVGAGTGTTAFDWKAGIGTASRRLPPALGGWTVGVLTQANHGGVLQIDGLPVGRAVGRHPYRGTMGDTGGPGSLDALGSIILVVATDAPLCDRNLRRLAVRANMGVARTGASFSNGSGDYAIAFSTHPEVRRTPERRRGVGSYAHLGNDAVSPLFLAAIEAAEEAVYNALAAAVTTESHNPVRKRRVRYEALTEAALAAARRRLDGGGT